jgi:acetyl-CoA acyltransferase
VGNAIAGLITGQEMVRGPVVLRPIGVQGIPVVTVENACASASTALHLAWQGIRSGAYDVVLALGVEQMVHPDRQVTFDAIGTAVDLEEVAALRARWGTEGDDRSLFMDLYAHLTRSYMQASAATVENLAQVVVKARAHAARNPLAQYRQPTSVEEVLAARTVVDPLTLPMCAPIGDGAAAVVLVGADHPGQDGRRPGVAVLGSQLRSGTAPGHGPAAATAAATAVYDQAGIGPEDVDVVELHDATAPAELMSYEHLGLAGAGEGPKLLADGATALGGRLPVNPSGGLLSRGHPIGATGLAQVCELVWQLRGEAGDRQVPGARVGLAHNGGGWLEGDSAAMGVHLLAQQG